MKLRAVCAPEDVGIASRGLETAFDAFKSTGLPGGVMTVARRGSLCFVGEFGVRDVESGAPMTSDSSFAIFSQTKIITSLATARLAERGALGVDDPVSKYLPELAKERLRVCSGDPTAEGFDAHTRTVPCGISMTVRHLLTHTSGLTYGMLFGRPDGDAMGPAHAPLHWSPRKAADFAAAPLCFQPGTRFRYSYGTALLGLVLEAVTSKPLATILQDEVFAPLQMDGTGFSLSDAGLSQLATPYLDTTTRSVGAPVPALLGTVRECFIERDPGVASMSAATLTSAAQLWGRGKSRPAGDQGLYSTPADWAKLEEALRRRGAGLLQRETFDAFHAAATPDLDIATGFNTHFSDQGPVAGQQGQGQGQASAEAPLPLPSGENSGGVQMYHSVGFGGIAHSLLSLVVTSEANAIGASLGAFGWEGMCCTKFEIDPVEELAVTWWAAVAPCWRFNLKGLCLPHIFEALTDPNVPHPRASESPTAWRPPPPPPKSAL
jgi:CubicO group peptidase (beta-lactamase class C family)